MGLSASQARLLSITSRLSDNELRSQTITTAKTSLANETTNASSAYIDALNSTELLYSTYDSSGNKVTEALTGASLSQYGELKNQYGIINQYGQILVSETDAANYEASADMYEFLEKYGVLAPEDEWETVQVVNPEWEVAWGEYNEAYAEWIILEPDPTDEKYWTESTDNELYQTFRTASETCYNNAVQGSGGAGCYLHVLSHLIDLDITDGSFNTANYPKTYTTTTGQEVNVAAANGSFIQSNGYTDDMLPVSEAVCDEDNVIYAAENEEMKNELLEIMNDPDATEQEKINAQLMNNYYLDENGEAQLKTLKQKCIDMYYVVSNYTSLGISYDPDLLDLLATFQEDMEQAFSVFDQDAFDADYIEWLEQEPAQPTVDYYVDETVPTLSDKDKGQWYINLWHRMNGESTTKAGTVSEDGTVVSGGKTSGGLPLYKVLEDGLMNSSEWLQYALENGTVTLEKVEFTDETEVGTGLSDCEWTSIIWTSSTDIIEEQNETAITLAEIEYEQRLNEIEAKDKQYDNQLKLLDTEHEALQTEYDSIKSIIEKTIERNLKLYS